MKFFWTWLASSSLASLVLVAVLQADIGSFALSMLGWLIGCALTLLIYRASRRH